MFTEKSLNQYIKNFATDCNKAGINFDKIILFGSYAQKTAKQYSDIDLALVSKDFSGSILHDRKKIAPINIHYVAIESHPFSANYFKKGDPFVDEIKRTGIEIKF